MTAQIEYDEALIEEIAARFDLRRPNRDALATLVERIADGDGFEEMVADLATGVGKTFLMAALIDYLAFQGVRNFLIVTPGSTIQRKTLENFDKASPKYVSGGETSPFIVTPDNYKAANVGAALRDVRRVKVFVFNIQQLLSPTAKASKGTWNDDENLGGALYQHLLEVDDLVIIADEHHVYRSAAKKFHATIRNLKPRVLVGLTATPDEKDYDKVVFEYTLGEAIADGYVKVPVIVYRKNGTADERTQLSDACELLRIKEREYDTYVAAHPDVANVKPVLFVVCQDIEHASEVGALLAQDGFIGEGSAVLEITSQSSDEALAALANVEDPDSPIRAIVSVNMLREGWDVKNIAVIVALRRLASQTLTEQILGRGLRLPFRSRTGVAMIDQVDLVAHDSYETLLEQKNVLRERIMRPERATNTDDQGFAPAPTLLDVQEAAVRAESGDNPAGTVTGVTAPSVPSSEGRATEADPVAASPTPDTDDMLGVFKYTEDGDTVPVLETRTLEDRQNTPAMIQVNRIQGAPQVVFPRRESRIIDATFTLADVSDTDARQAGRDLGKDARATLSRDALEAERHGKDVTITRTVQESAYATPIVQDLATVRIGLVQAILRQPEVPQVRSSYKGADRIVAAFMEGAGVHDDDAAKGWSEARNRQAVAAMTDLIRSRIMARPKVTRYEFVPVVLPVEPVTQPEQVRPGHSDEPFQKGYQYGHWQKNIMPSATFDAASTEWALAKMLDRDPAVQWWLRLYTNGDAYIPTERGRYFPDFVVLTKDGTHWLVEAKSDRDVLEESVVLKRDAARTWARAVRDEDEFGTWRYMFASESHIGAADGWESLVQITQPEG
ncbi:hypothetical protein HMPREF2863_05050 [Micrococcus sp. HMSC067E09]|uniref:DEAD/DEAH box helicase family protein n=1 Tax=Micrococcus sp. HMSC067E09 TaxID=1739367 RepID=UPI0008A51556|nr:DEAD/DEAH box helicase family protein [Micrococcus sp. HMSC067E09]OFR91178.1 hypothetical protein HMPREF2863_05050 [Micrococcus sp. HMSC067E09]